MSHFMLTLLAAVTAVVGALTWLASLLSRSRRYVGRRGGSFGEANGDKLRDMEKVELVRQLARQQYLAFGFLLLTMIVAFVMSVWVIGRIAFSTTVDIPAVAGAAGVVCDLGLSRHAWKLHKHASAQLLSLVSS